MRRFHIIEPVCVVRKCIKHVGEEIHTYTENIGAAIEFRPWLGSVAVVVEKELLEH